MPMLDVGRLFVVSSSVGRALLLVAWTAGCGSNPAAPSRTVLGISSGAALPDGTAMMEISSFAATGWRDSLGFHYLPEVAVRLTRSAQPLEVAALAIEGDGVVLLQSRMSRTVRSGTVGYLLW